MPDNSPPRCPTVRVAQLQFSGGEIIDIGAGEIVVFVGPNNGGKTTALRAIEETSGYETVPNRVLQAATAKPPPGEMADFLIATDLEVAGHPELRRSPTNYQYSSDRLTLCIGPSGLGSRATWEGVRVHFLNFCECRNRHALLEPVSGYDPLEGQQPTQPLQKLARDSQHLGEISKLVRKAFGRDFYLYTGGTKIHPFIGDKPKSGQTQSLDRDAVQAIRDSGQPAAKEGDGIVHFVAVLASVYANRAPILLLDEPEAFLHPPQARFLGAALAGAVPLEHQLFVATHSLDVLLGLLDKAPDRLHIVRITRDDKGNHGKELSPKLLKETWKSPLARHTRILDALFHERAVICEADGDCDFYRVVADEIVGRLPEDERGPDVHFVPTLSNSRLKDMAELVRPLGVPTIVAPDFDTLRERGVFEKLVGAMGGTWSKLVAEYDAVVQAINGLPSASKSPAVVKAELQALVNQITTIPVDRSLRGKFDQALKPSDGWTLAKKNGESVFSDPSAKALWTVFLSRLRALGIELNPNGEMESFVPSVTGHGPSWVATVLQEKDLATDPELEAARGYVARLVGISRSAGT